MTMTCSFRRGGAAEKIRVRLRTGTRGALHAGFGSAVDVTLAGTPSLRSLACSLAGSRSRIVTVTVPSDALATVQAVRAAGTVLAAGSSAITASAIAVLSAAQAPVSL